MHCPNCQHENPKEAKVLSARLEPTHWGSVLFFGKHRSFHGTWGCSKRSGDVGKGCDDLPTVSQGWPSRTCSLLVQNAQKQAGSMFYKGFAAWEKVRELRQQINDLRGRIGGLRVPSLNRRAKAIVNSKPRIRKPFANTQSRLVFLLTRFPRLRWKSSQACSDRENTSLEKIDSGCQFTPRDDYCIVILCKINPDNLSLLHFFTSFEDKF